jgi:hypothetical protein
MKFLTVILLIMLSAAACKDKRTATPSTQPQPTGEQSLNLATYYVLIDAVQQTESGPVDTNTIDTVYCRNDRDAIIKGVKNYYDAIVAIETRSKGIAPAVPYLLTARGWAVLDAAGENVKDRVSPSFVDSVNVIAVEDATSKIANAVIQ